MALDTHTRSALIDAVRAAARAEILPRFRSLAAGDIRAKSSSQDLVTEADTGAEAHIRRAAADILPEARIIGEEGVAAHPTELDALAQAGLTLIIDPVDGTWNFAHGLALFGTLLAVTQDGDTVFGLLYDPLQDDWVEAIQGEGAFYVAGSTRVKLTLSAPPPLDALTGLHGSQGLSAAAWQAAAAHHTRFARVTSLRASVWDYRLQLTGGAAFCLNRYLNVWDHAAGVLALTEAGGYAATLDGHPYRPDMRNGFLLTAQSEPLWHQLAELFGPALLPHAPAD